MPIRSIARLCPLPFGLPAGLTSAALISAALLVSGCAALDAPPAAPPPTSAPMPSTPPPPSSPVAESPAPVEAGTVVVSPVSVGAAPATNIPQRQTNVTLLAYADKVRSLSPPDLAQEATRLNDTGEPNRQPSDDLQLAMVLGQTRGTGDLARAQTLLQRVLSNNQEDVRLLHPLARLLGARYAEQRRLEEQLDRQGQQLRESQRRIDQLNDRLEAMRAIERSLTSRSAPAGPAPRPANP